MPVPIWEFSEHGAYKGNAKIKRKLHRKIWALVERAVQTSQGGMMPEGVG